ncbi:MAG: fibronectin type III domain-containing protein [Acidobacteriota bacterium]|nr:fibronectin type III domain-containing protein [Acidobacteriota bacterium]
MPTDEAMVDRSPVIVFGEVVAAEPAPVEGIPSTDFMFQVEDVLKGFVPGGTIVVRQPGGIGAGGMAARIMGLPDLVEGDRMLLFLDPVEGAYRTVELALGMFFEVRAGGRTLLVRESSLGWGAPVPDDALSNERVRARLPRHAEPFRRWIADVAAGREQPADYFAADLAEGPVAVASPYNLTRAPSGCERPGTRLRWRSFDRGESVGMVVQASGQPGAPGGGRSSVLAGMRAWNGDPRSRVHLVQSGFTNEEFTLAPNGENSIGFEDPQDQILGSFTPETGGILAIAAVYFYCGASTPPHPVPRGGGVQAYEIVEANIATQDGYREWLARNPNPRRAHDEIMTHELGHALGISHSCADEASGPCNELTDEAIMRATAHGDGRGGALNRDDRNAVRFLYPVTGPVGPVGPAAPSDLTVTAISQTELELRWQDRSGNETGFEIHERMVDSEFMRIDTLPANTTSVVIEHIPPASFRAYQVVATNNRGRSSPTLEVGATTLAEVGECVEDGDTVCLNEGRFRVELQWESADDAGAGAAVPLTNDTGYSWFFNEDNVEVVVKVLDGCAFNQRYWVFAGGLTDVEVIMKVIDSETGVAATYYNRPGTAFEPVQDQETFAVCSQGANLYGESRYLLAADEMEALRGGMDLTAASTEAAFEWPAPFQVGLAQDGGGSCVPDERTLCLEKGRFSVRATWEKPDGETGDAVAWPLTGDTGLYWFFAPSNVEMVLKVLDGCGINQHRWVFAGGLTDVGVAMTVTDTETGQVQRYGNPVGTAFQPVQDLNAFACSAP